MGHAELIAALTDAANALSASTADMQAKNAAREAAIEAATASANDQEARSQEFDAAVAAFKQAITS